MKIDASIDEAMMRRALELAAEAAAAGEVPVGAVIYRDDKIIAEGANRRERDADPTAHAEIIALRSAGAHLETWRLNDCTMAVTLEPCTMCAGAMVSARLGRVIWGAHDPKAGACVSLYHIHDDARLNHRIPGEGGLLADDSVALLQDFFKRRRAP